MLVPLLICQQLPAKSWEGRRPAALHNQFPSPFLSLVMADKEKLLSQSCTFYSSSWGGERNWQNTARQSQGVSSEVMQGLQLIMDLSYLQTFQSFCQDPSGFVFPVLGCSAPTCQPQPERQLLPYARHTTMGIISQFTHKHFNATTAKEQDANNSIQGLAMLLEVCIHPSSLAFYFKSAQGIVCRNLPGNIKLHLQALTLQHAEYMNFKDRTTSGSQLGGFTVINYVDHPVSTFFSSTDSHQAGKLQNSTNTDQKKQAHRDLKKQGEPDGSGTTR